MPFSSRVKRSCSFFKVWTTPASFVIEFPSRRIVTGELDLQYPAIYNPATLLWLRLLAPPKPRRSSLPPMLLVILRRGYFEIAGGLISALTSSRKLVGSAAYNLRFSDICFARGR